MRFQVKPRTRAGDSIGEAVVGVGHLPGDHLAQTLRCPRNRGNSTLEADLVQPYLDGNVRALTTEASDGQRTRHSTKAECSRYHCTSDQPLPQPSNGCPLSAELT